MMAVMATPRKRRPSGADNPWPARLKALKTRFGRTDESMAAMLRIRYRVWVSWLYGERKPSATGQFLIELAEAGLIPDAGDKPKPPKN